MTTRTGKLWYAGRCTECGMVVVFHLPTNWRCPGCQCNVRSASPVQYETAEAAAEHAL